MVYLTLDLGNRVCIRCYCNECASRCERGWDQVKNRGLLLVYSRPKPHATMHRSSTCFVGYLFVVALNFEKDVYPVKITDHQQVIMDKHIRRKLVYGPCHSHAREWQ